MLDRLLMDDFVLLDPDVNERWLSVDIEGLSAPSYRLGDYEKPGEDGAVVASEFYGGRVVTLPGKITASSASAFAQLRRELEGACYITRDSAGRPVAKRFTGRTLDGEEVYFNGFVRPPVLGGEMTTWCSFLLTVFCPDHRIYIDEQVSSGQVTPPSSEGVDFPWVFDPTIEFGATTGGSAVLNNLGTTDTWPIITLRGPLTNPSIYHEGKAVTMQLNAELVTDDVVVIDMKEKTIVLNGATNYLSKKTTDSEWFSLAPGNNVLRFSTGLSADTGTMKVTFNPALIGV